MLAANAPCSMLVALPRCSAESATPAKGPASAAASEADLLRELNAAPGSNANILAHFFEEGEGWAGTEDIDGERGVHSPGLSLSLLHACRIADASSRMIHL